MITKTTPYQAHRKVLFALVCLLLCCILISCGTDQSPQDTNRINENDFPITGHLLYGYKHGLMVYGQYMDQAGDNNAMILLFVEKDNDCIANLLCKSISINGTNVIQQNSTENISDHLAAIEVDISSSTIEVDELQEKDTISITFEIVDSQSGQTLEVTTPITIPCN